jgi:hypothetical protein
MLEHIQEQNNISLTSISGQQTAIQFDVSDYHFIDASASFAGGSFRYFNTNDFFGPAGILQPGEGAAGATTDFKNGLGMSGEKRLDLPSDLVEII